MIILDTCIQTKQKNIQRSNLPAVWVIVEAIYGAITERKANIVEASNSQATIYPNIDKVLLLPPLPHTRWYYLAHTMEILVSQKGQGLVYHKYVRAVTQVQRFTTISFHLTLKQ